MSTYYQYRDVKVMIAHRLMEMDGWKVYGYHKDNSNSMYDYYDPARWEGIAEKNGYILVVNCSRDENAREIRKYNNNGNHCDKSISDKISKLEQMTVKRGASLQEEETAKAMIEKLLKKASEINGYVVTGIIPAHMANPTRMNWHIEKDGIYVAKGNGILKYSVAEDYYKYDRDKEDLMKFKQQGESLYKQNYITKYMNQWYCSETNAIQQAEYHIDKLKRDIKVIDKFEDFIKKIDITCGGSLGNGDAVYYEKAKVTEKKKVNKAIITETGSIKEGQCFITNVAFNYNHNKGNVYRIHESIYGDKKRYHAYKLNGKLTKECTGNTRGNYWYIADDFTKWIDKGNISWCEIKEVKTTQEKEKVVKRVIKANR